MRAPCGTSDAASSRPQAVSTSRPPRRTCEFAIWKRERRANGSGGVSRGGPAAETNLWEKVLLKLRSGDHDLDLRMLGEQALGAFGIVGVKGVETRFAEDVGGDHSDKGLVFID